MDTESPTKLIRTLSSQHWEVTEDYLIKNSLLEEKAGEYGNYKFIVCRESLQSNVFQRKTYEHGKLVSSVEVPVKTRKEYIDFYGYDRDKYEELTKDFMECIRNYSPVLDPGEVRQNQSTHRSERVIWTEGVFRDPNFNDSVEKCMREKGYIRYKDYNFYEHSKITE